eukprot:6471890-Amphidinium_carterae.1
MTLKAFSYRRATAASMLPKERKDYCNNYWEDSTLCVRVCVWGRFRILLAAGTRRSGRCTSSYSGEPRAAWRKASLKRFGGCQCTMLLAQS